MKLAVSTINFPVATLGFGRRVGIWTQGCSIRCPGCVSRDTWESSPDYLVEIGEIFHSCEHWFEHADGLTISGGEPFDQPKALHELVVQARQTIDGDILVFSGYTMPYLHENHADVLDRIDVLVAGPYEIEATQTMFLRGSDNQVIEMLTDLAIERYAESIECPADVGQRRMDLLFQGGKAWFAGIPAKGDMTELRRLMARRGYYLETSEQALA